MVQINIAYENDLHCAAVHGPSGARIATDAPVDNQGRGESFSPTDLVATALGACMATIMGIYARRQNIDLRPMTVRVDKTMADDPRRIAKLAVEFHMPKNLTDRHRTSLERAARECPVHHSIHPGIDTPIVFLYDT